MQKGKIITFEGPDGAGKTTILERLRPLLRAHYQGDVVVTREPGGVAIAEAIREVILDTNHTAMDAKTELLLYMAARRQHYVEKVLPAVLAGKLVLIDRFIDSSVAYQGAGRGLPIEVIDWLNAFSTDDEKPDLTLYFDVESEIGLARIAQNASREVNRLDLEAKELHQRVRTGYQTLAKKEPTRIVTIDASQPVDEVTEVALQVIATHLSD